MYHDLFADFDFPTPSNFNDDYAGRLAASENMMEIGNHLNRRDMKQVPPSGLTRRDSDAMACVWRQGAILDPT